MSHFWFALGLVVAGCSTPFAGEVSALRCKDTADNDGDLFIDCRDPDCQAYEHCRLLAMASDAATPDAGDVVPPPRIDAAVTADAGDAGDGAAGDASVVDAGRDAGGPCPAGCSSTEVCIDGVCMPPPPAMGLYSLRVLTAYVPDQNVIARCYDDVCDSPVPSPPFGYCTCPPDPFVRVMRLRDAAESEVGRTPAFNDEREPDFSDTAFTTELLATDRLRFSVLDEDPMMVEEAMYDCEVPAPLPSAGMIACTKVVGADTTTYEVTAELVAIP